VSSLSDIDAAPVIDNGRVYAVGQGGRMVALELTTGQRLWELNIAGISTPWVAGEWIFVVTDDARLVAIARATGKIRWISQLARYEDAEDKKGPISWNGPVLAGGRLILTNSAGQMASVNPTDGTLAVDDQPQPAGQPVAGGGQQHAVHSGRRRQADGVSGGMTPLPFRGGVGGGAYSSPAPSPWTCPTPTSPLKGRGS
jgi:glucose dehydrogenase